MSRAGHVVVVGAGASGCLLAILLRTRGMAVTLVDLPVRPRGDSVEAIPEPAIRLLSELGLLEATRRAGAVPVRGFDNAWDERAVRVAEGWFLHVEREALAASLRAEAMSRGAALRQGRAGPLREETHGVRADVAGEIIKGDAAVDATGRAAFFGRPVRHATPFTACLFDAPGSAVPGRGRVVRVGEGAAYRLDHPGRCTAAAVYPSAAEPPGVRVVARALGLEGAELVQSGYRAASVQWSSAPVRGRTIAVGDAALAYDPVAGQGIRFALQSALAAAAVLDTWRRDSGFAGPMPSIAAEYYRDLIDGARARHERSLARLRGGPDLDERSPEIDIAPGDWVEFCGSSRRAGLVEAGFVVEREAWVLADGGLVRYLGSLDLALLRDLATRPRRASDLCAELCALGVSDAAARSAIRFCASRGLMARVGGDELPRAARRGPAPHLPR
ncbi:FAD-dependent oxidoreductase [Sorangium sp. So ce1153]|uniref:FAD-dependent oxidoreductase n=1 Tax=Sorangium sp. So ce1153 TaxID=3133333 RepID=UPI003F63FBE4